MEYRIGSYAIAAIAGTSTGILLFFLIIVFCTICIRDRCYRKWLKYCFRGKTSGYSDFDVIAGESPSPEFLGQMIEDNRASQPRRECNTITSEDTSQDMNRKPCMLQFSLFYNHHNCHLYVHIICALHVPVRWHGKGPDTQIRIQLLPDIENIYQTEIRTNGTQPIFNETFEFAGFSARDLLEITLRIGFYAFDRFSRSKLLGHTTVPFEDVVWHPTEPNILWRSLGPPARRERSPSFVPGVLHVSLRYDELAGRISTIVLKGTNLSRASKIKCTAPYVSVILHVDDLVLQTRQTKRKRSVNPVWNQGFLFDVDSNRIQDYSVTFRVMNYDLLLSDDLIGELVISAHAEGSGREHWDEMFRRKHVVRQIAKSHGIQ